MDTMLEVSLDLLLDACLDLGEPRRRKEEHCEYHEASHASEDSRRQADDCSEPYAGGCHHGVSCSRV